jgi:acetyl/propionyl-CoA carboxylase alpha subunit
MATSAELAAKIADSDAHRVTSVDATNEALAQYGVPEIRKNVAAMRTTVANTQNSLNAVDPSVTGRTSQSLVTEAQRQKQVANERAPIAEQLQGQNQALGQQSQDLNDATSQATVQATNRVNDWQTGRQALQQQYDNTYKAEQDSIAAQIAREQAARAQANEDRNYALSVQSASSRSSGGGGGGAKASPADVKLAVAQHVAQGLSSSVGKDGKVSNETWAAALNDAVSAGFTVREFWQKYGQFVNTKYKSSYAGYVNR